MDRLEALPRDGHFERFMSLKIAIPLRSWAEPGDDHALAASSILSDHLEHRAVPSPGFTPHMCEQQEPSAKDPAEVPVIDTDRSTKHTTQNRPGSSVRHNHIVAPLGPSSNDRVSIRTGGAAADCGTARGAAGLGGAGTSSERRRLEDWHEPCYVRRHLVYARIVTAVWVAVSIGLAGLWVVEGDWSGGSGGGASGADFCASHHCIPSFDSGPGEIVACEDGRWSQSGGLQGACSSHGGER